jgi:hypothetical protein
VTEPEKTTTAHNTNPRAFDLSSKDDTIRLIRETIGYLETCRKEHHGTDWTGRHFALEGLKGLYLELKKAVAK